MKHRMVFGLATALLLAGGLAQAQAPAQVPTPPPAAPPAPDPEYLPYARPGILAEVAPGRKIHLICMGQGSPTVILTAGLGNWSETWRKVQPAVAQKTRVCGWDRPGYGFSSPSPEPQDVAHTTADLEAALKVANIRGPYILVGHSLGGYESLLFADRHPHEVAGMVLVDPSVPDQHQIMVNISPEAAKFEDSYIAFGVKGLRLCAAALRGGSAKVGDKSIAECIDDRPTYPPELKASLAQVVGEPARYETEASLAEHFADDAVLVIKPTRGYGDIPLIVLTAGQVQTLPPEVHATPAMQAALTEFLSKAWPRAHDAIAALSTHGRNVMVPDSSHYIQQIKPQLTIDSIDEVIDAARKSGR